VTSKRGLHVLLSRFSHSERAAAAVEFALIVPFLITLYMGSIEASSLFTVDRRIEVISSTVADPP
jgi:Flp pilus assembly protein TadG